jgi:hypothetical protein
MVAGFLGTLIALERAVAMHRNWMYLSPLFLGLAGLWLIFGNADLIAAIWMLLGSVMLLAIFYVILRQHAVLYTITMALGVFAFALGSLFWLLGWSIPRIVPWWEVFLVLTIAGERLELGRLLRLSQNAIRLFTATVFILIAGLVWTTFDLVWGTRLFSLGLLALSAWLLKNDIARRTVYQVGLPRYAAACLLFGYVWLGVGGILGIVYGGQAAGLLYDAMLHAVFIGFVISMIFGHAPIIFPAILGLPIKFHRIFYSHLALLHLSLVLRLAGDLSAQASLRLGGGLLNGISILLFLLLTGASIIQSKFSDLEV